MTDPGIGLFVVECAASCRGNPGPSRIAVRVRACDSAVDPVEEAEDIGTATSNLAEYRAALLALATAKEMGATNVVVRSGSELLVEQAEGRWRVRDASLRQLWVELRAAVVGDFQGLVTFERVPREEMAAVRRLARDGGASLGSGPCPPGA